MPRPYNLFVSYARDPDYRLARSLTGFLEAFHRTSVPSRSAGEGPRLTPLKVCLDGVTFSLPPGHDAPEAPPAGQRGVNPVLQAYLGESRELLLLCSPQSARSPWVNREIQWWLENRGAGSIRLAITCGDDQWSDPESFFPPAIVAAGVHESICYDFRGFDDKRARRWRKVADFDSERVRLAADLNGESAGDILPLWFRDQRRRQRRRIITGVVTSAIVLVTVAFALLQRQHGIEQSASRLVAESFELLERDPAGAMMKAVEARNLHDTSPARDAIQAAYRVLVFHARNRRESAQLTGSGPGYLAARWREGELYSVFSDDGRHVLHATGRSSDGARTPGQVYLVDNETLRIIELETPKDWGKRRVEYLGFDRSNRHVFVSRQFYLAIFELDGSLAGTVDFSRYTKSPIHRVDGYLQDRYLIGADGKGGLWMVEPSADATAVTLQREWHGDPLVWSRIDVGGDRAGLVFESGRAALLDLSSPGAKPRLIDAPGAGVLFAGFLGRDRLVLAGEDGLLQTWSVTAQGGLEPVRHYVGLEGDLDWVAASADGATLLTTAYDNTVTLLDSASGTVLERINRTASIDWPSVLRRPKQDEPPPGARALTVAGRRWLASPQGAYLVEDQRLIAVTEPFRAIHDIVHAGGSTWLLSGAPPSELLRVDGYLAYPSLRALGKVDRVLDLGDRALFATTSGVWRFHRGRFDKIRGIELHADSLQAIGAEVWAGTSRGLLWRGPAYRVDGLNAKAYPDADTPVSAIVAWQGAAWLLTGGPIENFGPAYRVVDGRAQAVPDERTATHSMQVAGGALWLLTRSSKPAPVNGPAWRWDGERALPLPSAQASVQALFEVDGEVWLVLDLGENQTGVTRYALEGSTSFALGDAWLVGIEKLAGAVWIATTDGAFRLDGGSLSRFPAEPLHVSRIVEREGEVWILSTHEAHRVTGAGTVRYATGGHPLSDVVAVNAVTWLLTKDIVRAGPAFRVCQDRLVAYDGAVDGIEAAGKDTRMLLQKPDFRIEARIVPAESLSCE